ncbi:MAG: hypothetical protein E7231_14400 [Cellulosilyticum sp.]|nr:hypothetical protein [Cellulosilyticum sp.]
MINKVTLTYENHEYIVKLGEATLLQDKDEERALIAFKDAVKNNTANTSLSFEEMIEKVNALNLSEVEINETYKAMECGDMKYFYHTGKVFYTGQGTMVLLSGGFEYFYEVLKLLADQKVESSDNLVELCALVITKNATYSLTEDGLSISSAVFSYGHVGYNFVNSKMNKGTSSEKVSFKEFMTIVKATL